MEVGVATDDIILCSHIGGLGIGMTVSRVLHHDLLLTNPHAAAKDVWEQSG